MNGPEAVSPIGARPTWARKRDGRVEPFDADRLSRSLFAATESLGEPDPLLARELTDGVLHFLRQEVEGNQVATSQIAETLIKVVRELGHPRLARAYAEHQKSKKPGRIADAAETSLGPSAARVQQWLGEAVAAAELRRRAAAACLAAYSLERVYGRNLAAAHREGLLVLHGLDQPAELAAAVVRPLTNPLRAGVLRGVGVFEAIEQARRYVGGTLAIDSPEHELARCGARIGEAAAYVRELELAGRTLGLNIVLNLGCEAPPAWAADSFSGPLFTDHGSSASTERVEGHLDALLEQLLHRRAGGALALEWHVGVRDFQAETGITRIGRLVRAALSGAPVHFVFDRPRRDVSLDDGLGRGSPALLCWVGLNLLKLRERVGSAAPETFVSRCCSLARLAVNAAVQRREFLRKHGCPERPAFLFDRAHLGLYLIGLPEAIREWGEPEADAAAPGIRFLGELLTRLHAVLGEEGGHSALGCVLEDQLPDSLASEAAATAATLPETMDWKTLLRHAGKLHPLWGRGKVLLPLTDELPPSPDEVCDLLRFAARQTSVHRVGFRRAAAAAKQLQVAWE
jgi:hypothetical protein